MDQNTKNIIKSMMRDIAEMKKELEEIKARDKKRNVKRSRNSTNNS